MTNNTNEKDLFATNLEDSFDEEGFNEGEVTVDEGFFSDEDIEDMFENEEEDEIEDGELDTDGDFEIDFDDEEEEEEME